MTTRSTRSAASRDERGAGLFPTVAGVAVFLTLLLLAVQVVFDLYATSAVTASAYDAARVVAGADSRHRDAAAADAADAARRSLGRYGRRVQFTWSMSGDEVVLRVVADNPGFLPTGLRRPLHTDRVDRTIRVRVERAR